MGKKTMDALAAAKEAKTQPVSPSVTPQQAAAAAATAAAKAAAVAAAKVKLGRRGVTGTIAKGRTPTVADVEKLMLKMDVAGEQASPRRGPGSVLVPRCARTGRWPRNRNRKRRGTRLRPPGARRCRSRSRRLPSAPRVSRWRPAWTSLELKGPWASRRGRASARGIRPRRMGSDSASREPDRCRCPVEGFVYD